MFAIQVVCPGSGKTGRSPRSSGFSRGFVGPYEVADRDIRRPANLEEPRNVTTPLPFSRRFRAAALIAGVAGAILSSPPDRSRAQSVKGQPKARQKAKAAPRYSVPPTFSNVPYGQHERQVLDFFKADTR